MEQRDICQRSILWLIGYEEAIIEVQSKKSSFAGDILAQSCTGPTFTYIHHTFVLFRGGHCAVCCVLSKIHSCVCLAVVVQCTFPFCPKYGYVLSSVQFVCTWCASGKVAPKGRKFCGKKMWQPEGDGPHIRITRIKAKNQECKNELRKCNSWSEINIPSEMLVAPSHKLLVHCLQRLHCYTHYLLFAV